MKEKTGLSIYEELLSEYGTSEFHLDMVRLFSEQTCEKAKREWKRSWEFCPTCGGDIDSNMDVFHRKSKTSFC